MPLETMMRRESGIVYAFAAASDGAMLHEAGDRTRLPDGDVVDTAARPESIQAFHDEVCRYREEDSRLVPRMYAQGRTKGVIDSPVPGVVVFAFGIVPEDVDSRGSVERVSWSLEFRKRVKSAMDSAYAATDAPLAR